MFMAESSCCFTTWREQQLKHERKRKDTGAGRKQNCQKFHKRNDEYCQLNLKKKKRRRKKVG